MVKEYALTKTLNYLSKIGKFMGKLKVGSILSKACALCGSDMKLRNSKYGVFYGCVMFPSCKGTHSAHQESGKPMGKPADEETKLWRMKAHKEFDKLWKDNYCQGARNKAYKVMQALMGLTPKQAHIAKFDIDQCKELITKVKQVPSDWCDKGWVDAL